MADRVRDDTHKKVVRPLKKLVYNLCTQSLVRPCVTVLISVCVMIVKFSPLKIGVETDLRFSRLSQKMS